MTRIQGPSEDTTCRQHVVPALLRADWARDQIIEQRYFTDGRIVPTGRGHRRREGRRADYLLEIAPSLPIAVVEAKRLFKLPGDGLQQAMRYAEMLGVGFAYSTNGRGIVEHGYDTGRQRELAEFPSPEELWVRHCAWRGISDSTIADDLALPFNRELHNLDETIKSPRYYQATAINLAVQGALHGTKRMLITMATGTGKTSSTRTAAMSSCRNSRAAG